MNLTDIVIVAPDTGFAKDARRYASYLRTSVAIADKRRSDHDEKAEILEIIGEVRGKTAVIVDDFTISGGTLVNVSTALMGRGAKEVYAVVSHGVLAEQAAQKIDDSPITQLLATDTVENHPNSLPEKIQFVSVRLCLAKPSGASIVEKALAPCSRTTTITKDAALCSFQTLSHRRKP